MDMNMFSGTTSGLRWDIDTAGRFDDKKGKYLEPYGFKVYSQNDEDGIISEIFSRIGETDRRFVEFGVENGLECNSHYLLLKGWSGLWIEGSEKCCKEIKAKFRPALRTGQLKLRNAFINCDNINSLIKEGVHEGEIDLLSIDVDGNDWHIWKCIEVIVPRVVIIEYNAKLPPECEWVMPYNADHTWDGSDRHGASLKALEKLGREKGYQLVGTNLNGANAFFVRRDLAADKFPFPPSAENLYNPPRFKRLRFENVHPPKNFLGYKTEGMGGVMDFLDDDKGFECVSGFYPAEYTDGIFSMQWMNKTSAVVYCRTDSPQISAVRLRYFNVGDIGETKLKIGEKEYSFDPESLTDKELCIKLDKPIDADLAVKMEFETQRLCVADSVMHNGDMRELGLGIMSIVLE